MLITLNARHKTILTFHCTRTFLHYYVKLAIRDGAFGACSLRGLPAAGLLRSPLLLALTLQPHTFGPSRASEVPLYRGLTIQFEVAASNNLRGRIKVMASSSLQKWGP